MQLHSTYHVKGICTLSTSILYKKSRDQMLFLMQFQFLLKTKNCQGPKNSHKMQEYIINVSAEGLSHEAPFKYTFFLLYRLSTL